MQHIEFKAFTLHDGEDVVTTEELHKFLEPFQQEPHCEWEGSDSGVSLNMKARPGDIIQLSSDGWVRVVRAESILTREGHKYILMARAMIEDDNGGHLIGTVFPGTMIDFNTLYVPECRWSQEQLAKVEKALHWVAVTHGHLGIESGLYIFCNGEEGELEEFVSKHADECPELPLAHKFLNDYFNIWCDT